MNNRLRNIFTVCLVYALMHTAGFSTLIFFNGSYTRGHSAPGRIFWHSDYWHINLYICTVYCSMNPSTQLCLKNKVCQNLFDNPSQAWKLQQSIAITPESSPAEYLLSDRTTNLPQTTEEIRDQEVVHCNVTRWIEEFPLIEQYYKYLVQFFSIWNVCILNVSTLYLFSLSIKIKQYENTWYFHTIVEHWNSTWIRMAFFMVALHFWTNWSTGIQGLNINDC